MKILLGVAILVASSACALPQHVELRIISRVAAEYRLDGFETAMMRAIRKHENGSVGLEFGVINPRARRFRDPYKSFRCQAQWCAGTISRRFTGSIKSFAIRYCRDDWRNWERSVKSIMLRDK